MTVGSASMKPGRTTPNVGRRAEYDPRPVPEPIPEEAMERLMRGEPTPLSEEPRTRYDESKVGGGNSGAAQEENAQRWNRHGRDPAETTLAPPRAVPSGRRSVMK